MKDGLPKRTSFLLTLRGSWISATPSSLGHFFAFGPDCYDPLPAWNVACREEPSVDECRLAEAGERRQVGAVLGGHERVAVSLRLVSFECAEADDPCARAVQFRSVVFERFVRLGSPTFT